MKRSERKRIRQNEAIARQSQYDAMDDIDKLEQIDNRRGKSAREKSRIHLRSMDNGE
jgi:hypothetical protein